MSMLTTALIQGLQNSDTPDAMIGGLRKLLINIEDAMGLFRKEISHLKGSGDYSTEGRQKRIVDAAVEAAEALRGIEASAAGYSDNIRQLRDGLKPDQRPTDSTLSFLQEEEVRRRLADMDELNLQIKYEEACRSGGPGADLIAAACENDPMPRLSEEVLQQGAIVRGERKSPEQAKLLGDVIRTRAAFKDSLSEAMGELRKNGLPADDWLAQVAKGEIVPA